MTCGVCDGPGGRWRCKAAMRKACDNASIRIDQLERPALDGIRERLLTPEIIGRFAAQLQRELGTQQKTTNAGCSRTEQALDETRLCIAKIVRRIEDDEDAPEALMNRLKESEVEEAQLAADLADAPDRTAVRLPANYEAVYAMAVNALEHHLASAETAPTRTAFRQLVETVVVHAGDRRGGKDQDEGRPVPHAEFAEAAVSNDERGTHTQQSPVR